MSRLFINIAKKIFLITIPPLLVLFLIYFFTVKSYYYNDMKRSVTNNLVTLKENINTRLSTIKKAVSYSAYLEELNNDNNYNDLKGVFYKFNDLYEIAVYNPQNDIIYGITRYDIFDKQNYKISGTSEIFRKNNDLYIKEHINLKSSGNFLEFSISARKFFLKYMASMPDDYDFFVLTKNKRLLYHNRLPYKMSEEKDIANIRNINLDTGKNTITKNMETNSSLVIILDSPNLPFILGTEVHNETIYAEFYSEITNLVFLIFFLLVTELVATYLTAKSISIPIDSLNKLSKDLEYGSFRMNILSIPDNELGDLIINFQSSAERIVNLIKDKDMQHEEILSLYNKNRSQYKKLDNLLNSITDGVYVVDNDFIITYINDSELYFLQEFRDSVIGKKCYEILYKKSEPCDECPLNQNTERKTFILNNVYLPELGRESEERLYVNMHFVPFGENEYIISLHDITQINMAFNEITEKENLLSNIFEASRDVIFLKDTEGFYIKTNNAFDDHFSLEKDFAVGKHDRDVFPDEIVRKFASTDKEVLSTNKPVRVDETYDFPDQTVYLETSKVPVKDEYDNIIGILGIGRNITERKNLEIKLRQEKEKLLITLHSIGDGVIVTDAECKIEMLNDVASNITCYSENEAKDKDINDIFKIVSEKSGERIQNPVETCIKTKTTQHLQNHTLLINKEGKEIAIADSAAPILNEDVAVGAVLVFRDETENRNIQEEMIKKQKLESVGVLAGGIAHDFNNILAAMENYLTILDIEITDSDNTKDFINNLTKLTERAKFLSNQLLTFSKGGAPVKKSTNIYNIIRETADFVLAGTSVNFQINKDPGLWEVDADPNQISQVIHNILLNARQALGKKGSINVSIQNVEQSDTGMLLPEGKYVKIDIADSGDGIPKKDINRIFEPFYSSKESGSGLGLSIVYSIIKKHDGFVTVDSEKNKGTVFTIYLKSAGQNSIMKESSLQNSEDLNNFFRNILIVDDEDAIRKSLEQLLKMLNCNCRSVKNGEDALQIIENNDFDLVISDLTMQGGMDGAELSQKIKDLHPDIKVIIMTGYQNNKLAENFKDFSIDAFLPKPFDINNLKSIINSIREEKDE